MTDDPTRNISDPPQALETPVRVNPDDVVVTYALKRYTPIGKDEYAEEYLWCTDSLDPETHVLWRFTPNRAASLRVSREEALALKRLTGTATIRSEVYPTYKVVKITTKKNRCGRKGHADLSCDCWNTGYTEGLQAGRVRERDAVTLWLERQARPGSDHAVGVRHLAFMLKQNEHRNDRRSND